MPQLPLANFSNVYDAVIQNRVTIVNASARHLELFQTRLAAISAQRNDHRRWYIVTDTLTAPEQAGIISTALTDALHAWFSASPTVHILIPSSLQSELRLPDPALYRQACLSLTTHQRLSLQELVKQLVTQGYARSRPTSLKTQRGIEPGTFRVRGEAVDIAHTALPGTTTLTFHGNELEQITIAQHRRQQVVSHLTLPPVQFPTTTVPLATLQPMNTFDLPPFLVPSTSAAPTAPISRESAFELIGSLEVGQPAVHIDHGIGIYEGMQRKSTNQVESEYIVLQYAAGDVLFVPVEFAHKVTPYIGEGTPTVHRLGGTVWAKTKRKAKEEAAAFAHELLKVAGERRRAQRPPYTLRPHVEEELTRTFPYELTPDQARTWQEVRHDMRSEHPIDRLIVGDVGFGKTEIAVRAARHVVENDRQVALIAPTTLLVQQHADTLRQRLPKIAKEIGVLSRFTSPAQARQLKQHIASGHIKIAIGTHALLSSSLAWPNLGLVIIDEEQKFGVRHKEHFKKLRASVDILSLSATPIPRTLAMALSGLRELSLIQTAPVGRQAVVTQIGPWTEHVLDRAIAAELARQGQTYIVAAKIAHLPFIQRYMSDRFPDARVGLAHGQLDSRRLASVMHDFDTGHLDILVSSNIVENGLDLPNANTLIVWNATYFGLADLYQLRGRVGRRDRQGFAYFFYQQQELTPLQRQRLASLTEASRLGQGWTIARRDLEIRGAGSLLGAKQHGAANEVGVQLYLDLINQAMQSTDSQPQAGPRAEINLPLSSFLPASYIPSTSERAQWYQRLSRARVSDLDTYAEQLAQRFGPLPEATQNLLLQLKLQHAAGAAGITKIDAVRITPPGDTPFFRVTLHASHPTTIETAHITAQFAHDLLAQVQSKHD